jgi:hypothetical protein
MAATKRKNRMAPRRRGDTEKTNQLLTADLRGFTLINQNPLQHGGTEGAEENQTLNHSAAWQPKEKTKWHHGDTEKTNQLLTADTAYQLIHPDKPKPLQHGGEVWQFARKSKISSTL